MRGQTKSAKTAIENLAEKGYDTCQEVVAFREDGILHERFQNALDQIAERTQFGEQQSITAVVGPTSSGKTALAREFAYQFSEAVQRIPEKSRSTLLCMELAAPEGGGFKWRDDFYFPALEALKEPCIAKKIDVSQLRDRLKSGDTRSVFGMHERKISELRNDFYAALNRAKVVAALFDEANHLRRPTTKSGVFSQYDSLKSRSNATATHFVLLGTTELADIFSISGAISKRVYPIWLSPYSEKETKLFGAAVLAIVDKLPIKISFSVNSKLTDIMRSSIGLVGLVHDWFDRVLVRAIRLGKNVITWKDMQEVTLHPAQLAGIVAEVITYNEVTTGINTRLKEQIATLFTPSSVGFGSGVTSPEAGRKSTSRKAGVRNPTRDKVGN